MTMSCACDVEAKKTRTSTNNGPSLPVWGAMTHLPMVASTQSTEVPSSPSTIGASISPKSVLDGRHVASARFGENAGAGLGELECTWA